MFGSNDQRQFHQTIAWWNDEDSERVETTQEESDDEMRTDKSYNPDEGSDTQSTVISDAQENKEKSNLPDRCNNWRFAT